MMFDDVRRILAVQCGLDDDRLLILGVSGGPDSLCLLDILQRCGYPMVVAHLDHALREESVADLRAVREITAAKSIHLVSERIDVKRVADEQGLSIEEAARTVRYQFLFRQAREFDAQAVLVGHNADDQVETVQMHLLRGAGLAGLRGMSYHSLPNAWSSDIPLVRPLLGCWREQIDAYLQESEIHPRTDSSNLDTKFYRNRLRHELIPYLESYNPKVKQLIWRTAMTLGDDYAVIETLVGDAWEICLQESGDGYLGFSRPALLELPTGVLNHLFRRALYHLRPDLRNVDYYAISKASQFLFDPPETMESDLIAGLCLSMEGDMLWVYAEDAQLPAEDWAQLPVGGNFYLPVPGLIDLGEGWLLRAEPFDGAPADRLLEVENDDPNRAWLDGEGLVTPLQVRTRKPGDRIQPLGMEGHSMKVADLMVNVKLPRRLRERYPIIVSGDQVVWLPGIHTAEPFRITEETREVVYLHLVRQNKG